MAATSVSGVPLRSEAFEAEVGGAVARCLLTAYADRLLVIVSQLGTLGSIISAERERVLGGGETYRVDTLLGPREQPLPELCARQLAERLAAAGSYKPLLLCLALRRDALTRAGVAQVVAAVTQHAAAVLGASSAPPAAQPQAPPPM
ncbi:Proteasome assembly chaperone 3 [Micractinium conductrix]|uniref:Proteasome assembly chaperone 3 n=1 Tax=Micractinium conductrix TaxID=554055 RepID=A0A2P6V944_9CHLO|nr:Proteasome assembly chaperone 3 [Micractinium conductrix]|eukprot:PSC70604.1 Proteasome assembly chaperone 3 [Micractinium conductrix]